MDLNAQEFQAVFSLSHNFQLQSFAITYHNYHLKLLMLRTADHYLGILFVIPRKDVQRPGSKEAAAIE